MFNFMPQPLYSRGKTPRYPLDRRLGVPPEPVRVFGIEKHLPPSGIRIPDRTAGSLIAVPSASRAILVLHSIRNDHNSWYAVVKHVMFVHACMKLGVLVRAVKSGNRVTRVDKRTVKTE